MQGRPQGVYFTLADMFLRNKMERLTNTALPALGMCVGKRKCMIERVKRMKDYAYCAVLKACECSEVRTQRTGCRHIGCGRDMGRI